MKNILKTLSIILLLTFTQLSSFADELAYNPNNLRSTFLNNEAIIYVINIRTFNAKDTNKNEIIELEKGEESGTFINAISKLDILADMGMNAVHVLPITPVGKIKAIGTAGSLYAISDFTTLNPQLGDKKSPLSLENQAKLFFDECHKRGIKVIVDLPSCGSYDLYLKQPDLFTLDRKQQPVIPSDWTDVRLFKTINKDGTLNEDLFEMHKKYVDLMMSLGADGIRADVATLKPYDFWAKLIKYARDKDPEFLFLAEASDSWSTPVSEYAVFTNYKKLLEAGFDGYYGSYFNFKNWKSANDLKTQVILNQNLSKNSDNKKSVIGSFATHDELSPIIQGKAAFSEMLMWLNATLPLNPYYVDGFVTGDNYLYEYSNKKASVTYTDDDYYYVHKGKLDIFNFSRAPGGNDGKLLNSFCLTMRLREFAKEIILKGNFKLLSTNNSKVFAYSRSYGGKTLIIILNKNLTDKEKAQISMNGINSKLSIMPIKFINTPAVTNGKINTNLDPAETIVLYIENFKY